MTAKTFIDSLNPSEFEKIRLAESSPEFVKFITEAYDESVEADNLAMKFEDLGVPKELTRSPESLHYLAVAINNRICGNA